MPRKGTIVGLTGTRAIVGDERSGPEILALAYPLRESHLDLEGHTGGGFSPIDMHRHAPSLLQNYPRGMAFHFACTAVARGSEPTRDICHLPSLAAEVRALREVAELSPDHLATVSPMLATSAARTPPTMGRAAMF
jgi:hypothetical protein